jgi:uncharacterized protein YcnI
MSSWTSVALILSLACSALSHVTVGPSEVATGVSTKQYFKVPHGCGTYGTTSISVTIPQEVTSCQPKQHLPWVLSSTTRALAVPIVQHGVTITTTLDTITWTGDNSTALAPAWLDEFEFTVTYDAKLAPPGSKVYWPIRQYCAVGQTLWVDLPVTGQATSATPAPSVKMSVPAAMPATDDWKASDSISVASIVISVGTMVGLIYQAMVAMPKGLKSKSITPTTEIAVKTVS